MQQTLFTESRVPRDITRRKHKGNAESTAAFEQIKPQITLLQALVLEKLHSADLTPSEIAGLAEKPLHIISGRCSELKEMGLVKPTGERRNRGAVLTKVKI